MTSTGFRWEDRFEQFDGLGETQLLHLARNEAVPVENRLFLVEILLKKGYQSAKHLDLKSLVDRFSSASEVEHESEIDPIVPENTHSGAPSASVTTLTMAQEPVIVQKMDKITPANEALISNNTLDTEKELTNE